MERRTQTQGFFFLLLFSVKLTTKFYENWLSVPVDLLNLSERFEIQPRRFYSMQSFFFLSFLAGLIETSQRVGNLRLKLMENFCRVSFLVEFIKIWQWNRNFKFQRRFNNILRLVCKIVRWKLRFECKVSVVLININSTIFYSPSVSRNLRLGP